MGWFGKDKIYDRSRLLDQATKARRKGKRAKSLELYRQVLAKEPDNPDILRRVGALLAETKQPAEAWKVYRKATEGLERRGFTEQAVGVLRDASKSLPHEPEIWCGLADLELKRGRKVDAHGALLEGRGHFRSRGDRDLAWLLARTGAKARATRLLAELANLANGKRLRQVRRRQFAVQPGPGTAWRWLRASFATS